MKHGTSGQGKGYKGMNTTAAIAAMPGIVLLLMIWNSGRNIGGALRFLFLLAGVCVCLAMASGMPLLLGDASRATATTASFYVCLFAGALIIYGLFFSRKRARVI